MNPAWPETIDYGQVKSRSKMAGKPSAHHPFRASLLFWLDTSLVIQTRMTVYPSLYPAFYRPRPLWRSFPHPGISEQRIPEESLPAFVIASPVAQICALGKET